MTFEVKTFLSGIRVIGLVGAMFVVVSCEPPVVEKVGGNVGETKEPSSNNPFRTVKPVRGVEPGPSGFPVSREITDVSGRMVSVTIIGRTADQVQFLRVADGKRFDLGLDQLSAIDREFVKKLPEVAIPAPVVVVEKPRYIEVREQDIAEMEAEVENKKAELKSKQLNSILENLRRRQITDLEKEIADLKLDIETFKRNNKL